ncbi:MAG TPA: C69 family dipeptidase [Bacteroidales bacterium]|nr:C69 family dipeptidase [Bacteroidales bacterium]HOL97702.1 C69 family dipeptidase [Bacteroidales bacterium]HOM37429.1 C69 family dipeptidase [Bacteroidales bacterium]HPD24934.1 C69 family dipeptidase [Bacteroidales bacterium]HRT00658.1 C69 family dipeptidase [Bacteroidales bacterium]
MKKLFLFFALVFLIAKASDACTNFIVTKGASVDGSVMVSYAADSHLLYGELYHFPAKTYPKGSKLKIYEWDTGKFLGIIDQVEQTYNVIGNVNEFQVAIGETTYGGREELVDTTGIMDYGSLIYIALQRSKSAREAIKIMVELMDKYGYCSSGESFSVCDKNEAWIFEVIGKGPGRKGAVWVAMKIPDGYVSAHANHARITTFPFQKKNDWFNTNQTVFHSPDVISFAREKGYYNGPDNEFSFSDTYAPLDFGGARFCEIRVWAFFNAVANGMDQYWDYAKGNIIRGKHDYPTNRMPLWVKPNRKLSQKDLFILMGDHLEGTELDMSKDIGAGPFGCPYRWRPLTWKVDGVTYCNERATATQQTAFSFIAQLRNWLPDHIGAINWFSVDDAATTVYVPMYTCMTETPYNYREGNGDLMNFTMESAFWVFNLVSNWAYTRYNAMFPDIQKVQEELHNKFISEVAENDKKFVELYNKDKDKAIAEMTKYSHNAAEYTHKKWIELFAYLFTKYMDGNIKTPSEIPEGYKYYAPNLKQPGYGEEWYRRIANETGDKLKVK